MNLMKISALGLFFIPTLCLANSASIQGSSYATAITNYCLAKSYLPFADSFSVCLGNAQENARAYVKVLNDAKSNIHNPERVVADIAVLQRSLKNQTTVVGIPIGDYIGTAELNEALSTAQTDASARNTRKLVNQIQYSKQVLSAFGGQI
jgi:hypothetical protein